MKGGWLVVGQKPLSLCISLLLLAVHCSAERAEMGRPPPTSTHTSECIVLGRLDDKQTCPESGDVHYGLVMRYTLVKVVKGGFVHTDELGHFFVVHGAPRAAKECLLQDGVYYLRLNANIHQHCGSLSSFLVGTVHQLRLKQKLAYNHSPFDNVIDPYMDAASVTSRSKMVPRYLCLRVDSDQRQRRTLLDLVGLYRDEYLQGFGPHARADRAGAGPSDSVHSSGARLGGLFSRAAVRRSASRNATDDARRRRRAEQLSDVVAASSRDNIGGRGTTETTPDDGDSLVALPYRRSHSTMSEGSDGSGEMWDGDGMEVYDAESSSGENEFDLDIGSDSHGILFRLRGSGDREGGTEWREAGGERGSRDVVIRNGAELLIAIAAFDRLTASLARSMENQ